MENSIYRAYLNNKLVVQLQLNQAARAVDGTIGAGVKTVDYDTRPDLRWCRLFWLHNSQIQQEHIPKVKQARRDIGNDHFFLGYFITLH